MMEAQAAMLAAMPEATKLRVFAERDRDAMRHHVTFVMSMGNMIG